MSFKEYLTNEGESNWPKASAKILGVKTVSIDKDGKITGTVDFNKGNDWAKNLFSKMTVKAKLSIEKGVPVLWNIHYDYEHFGGGSNGIQMPNDSRFDLNTGKIWKP